MKSSLWPVITLVTGIVGFLVGYSVSGYTGKRNLGGAAAAHAEPAPGPKAPGPKAPGAAAAARPEAGGYGAAAEKPKEGTKAAGY